MQKDFSFGLVPVFRSEDGLEFLLTQHIQGHWGFPKGHAEGRETALAAAQREFEEETGILDYQVDEQVVFSEEYYPQQAGQVVHKTVTYYLAWVSKQQVNIQAEEVQDYEWLDYPQAREKLTYPGGKKILRAVKKYLAEELQA